jgi:small subunit ribosomal protein S17
MNKRRRLTGTVKSNKMDKTVIVEVIRTYQHPLYQKVVRSAKNYKAHDELGCNVGDKVIIVESKPISKTVTWVVEKIVRLELRQEGIESTEAAIEEVEALVAEAEEVLAEEIDELEEELVEQLEEELEEEIIEELAEVVEIEEEDAE